MSFIKAHWKQILTLVLSLAVGVGLHLGKLDANQATAIGAMLALVGIHLAPITYGSKKLPPPAALPVLALVAVGAMFVAPVACTNAQATQVKTIVLSPDAAQCVEAVIGDATGSIDIAGTLAHCGITVEALVAYLESYFASPADAGTDGAPLLGASPAKLQRVGKMLDAAKAYQAAHQ